MNENKPASVFAVTVMDAFGARKETYQAVTTAGDFEGAREYIELRLEDDDRSSWTVVGIVETHRVMRSHEQDGEEVFKIFSHNKMSMAFRVHPKGEITAWEIAFML